VQDGTLPPAPWRPAAVGQQLCYRPELVTQQSNSGLAMPLLKMLSSRAVHSCRVRYLSVIPESGQDNSVNGCEPLIHLLFLVRLVHLVLPLLSFFFLSSFVSTLFLSIPVLFFRLSSMRTKILPTDDHQMTAQSLTCKESAVGRDPVIDTTTPYLQFTNSIKRTQLDICSTTPFVNTHLLTTYFFQLNPLPHPRLTFVSF
jgi:hypothetical protein